MSRPKLEVADIFRGHGAAWRSANAGHVSLDQLKVMSAIERCRTAALGGHVERCEKCSHTIIAYNSCRNRHCPKCQGAAAREWLAERKAELLPVPYYHVVFTLPARIADIAYQNKAVIYDLLFKASSETMLTIAADPKHLGARIGILSVLHTWGSAMTHHPHASRYRASQPPHAVKAWYRSLLREHDPSGWRMANGKAASSNIAAVGIGRRTRMVTRWPRLPVRSGEKAPPPSKFCTPLIAFQQYP